MHWKAAAFERRTLHCKPVISCFFGELLQPVILSAAKNLLFPTIYKQVLRCAQHDRPFGCGSAARRYNQAQIDFGVIVGDCGVSVPAYPGVINCQANVGSLIAIAIGPDILRAVG